jgi:hypothetical protein
MSSSVASSSLSTAGGAGALLYACPRNGERGEAKEERERGRGREGGREGGERGRGERGPSHARSAQTHRRRARKQWARALGPWDNCCSSRTVRGRRRASALFCCSTREHALSRISTWLNEDQMISPSLPPSLSVYIYIDIYIQPSSLLSLIISPSSSRRPHVGGGAGRWAGGGPAHRLDGGGEEDAAHIEVFDALRRPQLRGRRLGDPMDEAQ